jgi:hypothetical protein
MDKKQIAKLLPLFTFFSFCWLTVGCSSLPKKMERLSYKPLKTTHFIIATWATELTPKHTLRIYIEGDSKANFFGKPEPKNKVVRHLAQRDKAQNVVYIAQPCQYIQNNNCVLKVWKNGRYAVEMVQAVQSVVEHYAEKYRIEDIELIGYDGGGTIAALIAARIRLPVKLITISGILDPKAYTALHKDELLYDPLNPMNENYILAGVPQVHYVAGNDDVFPKEFTETFVAHMPNPVSVQVRLLQSATHDNWDEKNVEFKF